MISTRLLEKVSVINNQLYKNYLFIKHEKLFILKLSIQRHCSTTNISIIIIKDFSHSNTRRFKANIHHRNEDDLSTNRCTTVDIHDTQLYKIIESTLVAVECIQHDHCATDCEDRRPKLAIFNHGVSSFLLSVETNNGHRRLKTITQSRFARGANEFVPRSDREMCKMASSWPTFVMAIIYFILVFRSSLCCYS